MSAGPFPLRRHAVLVICLVAYLLMALLVVQQSQTIDSQRTLIQQLFHDSLELSALKAKRVLRSIKQ